jgi:hypothetical protein
VTRELSGIFNAFSCAATTDFFFHNRQPISAMPPTDAWRYWRRRRPVVNTVTGDGGARAAAFHPVRGIDWLLSRAWCRW